MTIKAYKFRPINKYLIDSIVSSSLYFPLPRNLNDPFDCRLDFSKSCHEIANKLDNERSALFREMAEHEPIKHNLRKGCEELGVCSFSLAKNETLLWSHYADNHRGCCIEYAFPESFLKDEIDDSKIMGVAKVAYDENPLSKWLDNITLAQMEMETLWPQLTSLLLTQKSPSWEYENEFRVIRFHSGFLEIPQSYIRNIIFGMQTSTRDIDLIKKIAHSLEYQIGYFKAENGYGDFGIQFIKI